MWEWQKAVVRNLGPRNSRRGLNSQFFHLLYSVMFQHEVEGTLETGAFKENLLLRDYLQRFSAGEPQGRKPGLATKRAIAKLRLKR